MVVGQRRLGVSKIVDANAQVNWPPLTGCMEGVDIVLLAGDPLEAPASD